MVLIIRIVPRSLAMFLAPASKRIRQKLAFRYLWIIKKSSKQVPAASGYISAWKKRPALVKLSVSEQLDVI